LSASRRCVELVLYLPQESSGSPTDKAGQALGAPVEAAVDRDPAEVAPLGSGPGVTGLFDGIIVKRGNLVLAHALGRKPGGICSLQSRSTSVKTLSVPVPVTGQLVSNASPPNKTPA